MNRLRGGRLLCVTSLLAWSVVATAQDSQVKKRLTPKEIEALPSDERRRRHVRIAGRHNASPLRRPTKSGLYTIELRVAPNTVIQAHTHRDTRTAVVISGLWHFGYGPKNEQALVKALPPGAFYTEPAGESHFARTGPEGATVSITGYGPTDTVYGK